MKKERLSTLLLVLVFGAGLAILLYPSISNWWNARVQSQAIIDYEQAVKAVSEKDYKDIFAAADAYNDALEASGYPLVNYKDVAGYEETLDVVGSGIMGYVTIERIGEQLPIYHGTSEEVLNVGVGHLEGSSLPVGGEGRHSVLSAHRGLPSAKLFSDLDKLKEGDVFTITILDRLLTYEVDQIRIVNPDELEELEMVKGKDYCTLLTCTPYGINTHRLLVRGHRTENAAESVVIRNEAYELDSLVLAPIVAAPMLLILFIILQVKYRKSKGKRKRMSRQKEGK